MQVSLSLSIEYRNHNNLRTFVRTKGKSKAGEIQESYFNGRAKGLVFVYGISLEKHGHLGLHPSPLLCSQSHIRRKT